MIRISQLFTIVAVFLFSTACSDKAVDEPIKPDTLVNEYDEDEMEMAIATARKRVHEFIETIESGDADSLSVEVPITDENGTEHFWITDVSFDGGEFKGLIGNDPGIVKNVKFGQEWVSKADEISDWMFMRGEQIHGGFTVDPLLDSYPKEDADALREKLVR